MNTEIFTDTSNDAEYCGRILPGHFSSTLKKRIRRQIKIFRAFDNIGTPVIPYIAACGEYRKSIWYEFIGRHFLALMGCKPSEAATLFRKSVLEQKNYSHQSAKKQIVENILGPNDLAGSRIDYRREAKQKGTVEAVYKIAPDNGEPIWLKDQALIEAFAQDRIHLSLGCLTIVTKEMEADEARKRMETALRNSEERFRHQAIHDNLTGLYNTRYLYEELDRNIEQSRLEKTKFSLIFFDIDDFKTVVDTHGHLNASRAIREVGASIQAAIKKPAYGVAYGGDEFIVVLPGCDKVRALQIAENIRTLMRRTVYLTSRGLTVKLEASFGVATFPDDADDFTTLIGLADRAMFGVKARGKNAVLDISSIAL